MITACVLMKVCSSTFKADVCDISKSYYAPSSSLLGVHSRGAETSSKIPARCKLLMNTNRCRRSILWYQHKRSLRYIWVLCSWKWFLCFDKWNCNQRWHQLAAVILCWWASWLPSMGHLKRLMRILTTIDTITIWVCVVLRASPNWNWSSQISYDVAVAASLYECSTKQC